MSKLVKLSLILLFAIGVSPRSHAQISAFTNYCSQGAAQATTSGLRSSNYQLGAIPNCTVTVYLTGTTTKATIYSNSSLTPLTNPFTAPTTGLWLFFASNASCYDVSMNGGIPPNTFSSIVTLTGICNGGGGGSGSVTSVALALPGSVFSISGSPVTGSGTLTGAFTTQMANTVFAGPASGAADIPTFRSLTAADIPFPTYTLGTTTLTPNGSNPTLTYNVASLPTISFLGSPIGNSLTAGYINCSANGQMFPCWLVTQTGSGGAGTFGGGRAGFNGFLGATADTDIEIVNCMNSTSGTCSRSLKFCYNNIVFGSEVCYGTISSLGSVFTNDIQASTVHAGGSTSGKLVCTQDGTNCPAAGTITLASVAAGTAPASSGTYNFANNAITMSGNITQTGGGGQNTFTANTVHNGPVNISTTGTATSGANFAAPTLQYTGSYWNGSAAAQDTWQLSQVLGSGTNPTSQFQLSHSGSTGIASVLLPLVALSTTTTVSALPSCSAGTKGFSTAVTDASSPTYLGTVTGGSSTYAPVICNGTNWVTY